MNVPPLVHRIKLFVATYGFAIAAVLAVVGLLAFGGAAWAITNPPTVEVTEEVATHTVGTDVRTSTVVTGDTTLWKPGTTLEQKPIYPLKSAPLLTVSVQTAVPDTEAVQVDQELTLVYQASKDGDVFWQTERALVSERHTVTDGSASVSTTLDMRQVRSRLDDINGEILGIGQAEASLRLNVSYKTDAYTGTISKTAPLGIGETGYWVGGSLDGENTHRTPVTREVSQPETSKALGLGLLGLLSLGGAGGVVYVSSRRLDPDDIADTLDRQRYREWVSAGRLGQFVTAQDIAMDSLRDLVDVAIDSKNRAIYDESQDLYAVLTNGVIYYYDPHLDAADPEIDFEYDFDDDLEVPLKLDGGFSTTFTDGGPMGGATPEEPWSTDGAASDGPFDPTEYETDAAAVERTVTRDRGRAVAVYRLVNKEPVAVTADVADRLPAECDRVESLRPLSGSEPTGTFGVEGGVGFSQLVGASGMQIVTFEICTTDPVTGDALEAMRAAPGPRVRRVVGADARAP